MVFCTGGDSWWLDEGKKHAVVSRAICSHFMLGPGVLAVLFRTLLTIPLLESVLASPELISDALSNVVYSDPYT